MYVRTSVCCLFKNSINIIQINTKYKLDAEAMGSTWYRNPRGSHIESEHVARGSMATRGFLYRVDPIGLGV